ncbi:MAG: hypothetical protein JNK02_03715 [Planctomycetes bacterium]|nr:hypothetical protein [Planctomycetota bacterium]
MLSLIVTALLAGQPPPQDPRSSPTPEAPLAPQEPLAPEEPRTWAFSLSAFYVDPPGDGPHGTTILYADRGPLHLEARYNYEDLDTFSLFGGWTFEFGSDFRAAFTPMIGGVAGETEGVAPALLIDAGWKGLEFYSESEYLFDLGDDEDYFYSWSTLLWRFSEPLAVGIVTERTKIVETDLELNRGLALQVSPGPVGFALYAYNVGSQDEYYTLSVDLSF